jgi:predicted RNase H-like HicB family nuclease
MFKNHYIYPAIFHYADDGISIQFPDLPGCITCGSTIEEALFMAKDALSLHLYGMEKDNDPIPEPSFDFELETNEKLISVEVFMPPFRDEMENKAVKKTLTVPRWLNDMAETQNINFSQILQTGLKQKLGIYRHDSVRKQY